MFPVNFELLVNTHPRTLATQFFNKNNKMNINDVPLIFRALVDVEHYWVNVADTSIVKDSQLRLDMATASEESDGFEEIMESSTNIPVSEIASFINTYRAIRALRSFIRLQEVGLLDEKENPYAILKLEQMNPKPKETASEKVTKEEMDSLNPIFFPEPLEDSWEWDELKDFLKNSKGLPNE